MPTYSIMESEKGMAATVAPFMPSPEEVRSCNWLTDGELEVYSSEFARTGFQGALNWYRCGTSGLNARQMKLFSGRTIQVPVWFLAGRGDWGPHQVPGALAAMATQVCSDFRGCYFIEGAGHWVQQEQPERTNARLLRIL